jgi:hypothetical protein
MIQVKPGTQGQAHTESSKQLSLCIAFGAMNRR